MSRPLSFWILLAAVVAVGVFFFHVIQPFLLPLFLALVLTLLTRPWFERVLRLCRGHRRVAALLTTIVIALLVVAPLAAVLAVTGQRLIEVADRVLPGGTDDPTLTPLQRHIARLRQQVTSDEFAAFRSGVLEGQSPAAALDTQENEAAAATLERMESQFTQDRLRAELNKITISDVLSPEESPWFEQAESKLNLWLPPGMLDRGIRSVSSGISDLLRNIYQKTRSFMAGVVTVVVGFGVMAFALYYFFADGPQFARRTRILIPLEDRDEVALFQQFENICRGVVLGIFVSALAQAVLLGLGLAVAGVPFVLLLSVVTMIGAMIPVVGAGIVYVPVAIFLMFQQRYAAGVLILCYGVGVVSTVDNLIRAYVLQGRAKLHPLVGLVSMLGGLQAIGLWGIFIGPIVAGFFYGLLKILHDRLEDDDAAHRPPEQQSSGQPPPGQPPPKEYAPNSGGLLLPK